MEKKKEKKKKDTDESLRPHEQGEKTTDDQEKHSHLGRVSVAGSHPTTCSVRLWSRQLACAPIRLAGRPS